MVPWQRLLLALHLRRRRVLRLRRLQEVLCQPAQGDCNVTTFDDAAAAYAYNELLHARPRSEWREGMGDKLWWCLKEVRASNGELRGYRWAGEPPYVGSPLDLGITVEAHVRLISQLDQEHEPQIVRRNLGGWPGYHTHFTDIVIPKVPK
jgi:hypothetical protein